MSATTDEYYVFVVLVAGRTLVRCWGFLCECDHELALCKYIDVKQDACFSCECACVWHKYAREHKHAR